MPKIVINRCFGGFNLSPKAVKRLAELQGRQFFAFKLKGYSPTIYTQITLEEAGDSFVDCFDIPNPTDKDWKDHSLTNFPSDRTDPLLVQVVEELGDEANGSCAELEIVEIPDGVSWEIDEYDGIEHIAEVHRTWH